MTPAPTMVIFLGTFSKLSAPVELTIIFSSKGIPGKGLGSLPVAIIILSDWISSVVPSSLVTFISLLMLKIGDYRITQNWKIHIPWHNLLCFSWVVLLFLWLNFERFHSFSTAFCPNWNPIPWPRFLMSWNVYLHLRTYEICSTKPWKEYNRHSNKSLPNFLFSQYTLFSDPVTQLL